MATYIISLVVFVKLAFAEGAYLGCFVDNPDRLLIKESMYVDSQLTNDKCIQRCTHLSHTLAGTEHSKECFCGDDIDFTKLVSEETCNMACNGNQNDTCGGVWVISVYKTAYLGCFVDNPDRLLIKESAYVDSQLTNDKCIQRCTQLGHTLAGTEYSKECYCGDDIDLTKLTSRSACNMVCKGNQNEMCGGPWALSVFYTGFRSTTVETPTRGMPTTADHITTSDIQTSELSIKTSTTNAETTDDQNTTVQIPIADSQIVADTQTAASWNTTIQTTALRITTVQTTITDTTDIRSITDQEISMTTLPVESENKTVNCSCCNISWNSLTRLSKEDQQKILYGLQSQLFVTKYSTSNFKQKFISKYDSRQSSNAIGCIAVIVLVLVTGIIVVPDFTRAALHIRVCKCKRHVNWK